MKAFLYGAALQWKLDIRSQSLLVTCYVVPLIFFLLMGSIFTSVMPEMKSTLIPSMIVMGVSMGALIGLPPSLIETYGSDVKKVYKANGVPLCFGLATMVLSAFVHLMMMCAVILFLSPLLFQASFPSNFPLFSLALILYTMVSLGIGSVLGLAVKSQAKLTMTPHSLYFCPPSCCRGFCSRSNCFPKLLRSSEGSFRPLGAID